MITTAEQYHQAQEELLQLEERLHRLQQSHPLGAKGFTKAGIRKMIARLHEELAVYEGSQEVTAVKIILANDSLFVCDTLRRGEKPRSDSHGSACEEPGLYASW